MPDWASHAATASGASTSSVAIPPAGERILRGPRAFPDKVNLALIIGWGRGSPSPTLAQKRRITIVLVDVGYTHHDHHLPDRVDEKHTKYVALAMALRAAGWKVILCNSAGDPDVQGYSTG